MSRGSSGNGGSCPKARRSSGPHGVPSGGLARLDSLLGADHRMRRLPAVPAGDLKLVAVAWRLEGPWRRSLRVVARDPGGLMSHGAVEDCGSEFIVGEPVSGRGCLRMFAVRR
jgi:hypothetical protein